ncbi:MAG TPA: ABC transporter ATP-binding protein, partial [Gammaproteobacteria bacterium]|nr:ABC transporter ATP-binding protein [Gammaproteobacteria bacterium]
MGTHRSEQAPATATEGIDILPLEVRGLTFVVGGQVLLDGISFDLEAGSLACIIGPNGAGKSLLLRLCHGLLRPSAGTVRWAGGTLAQQQRAQAMVFQRPVLLRRSVRANVEHALAVRGCERVERRERALAVLEKTGLADKTGRDARVLSGGEQQRLALARAWVLQPQVLFLDEPTAHLDPAATRA